METETRDIENAPPLGFVIGVVPDGPRTAYNVKNLAMFIFPRDNEGSNPEIDFYNQINEAIKECATRQPGFIYFMDEDKNVMVQIDAIVSLTESVFDYCDNPCVDVRVVGQGKEQVFHSQESFDSFIEQIAKAQGEA